VKYYRSTDILDKTPQKGEMEVDPRVYPWEEGKKEGGKKSRTEDQRGKPLVLSLFRLKVKRERRNER